MVLRVFFLRICYGQFAKIWRKPTDFWAVWIFHVFLRVYLLGPAKTLENQWILWSLKTGSLHKHENEHENYLPSVNPGFLATPSKICHSRVTTFGWSFHIQISRQITMIPRPASFRHFGEEFPYHLTTIWRNSQPVGTGRQDYPIESWITSKIHPSNWLALPRDMRQWIPIAIWSFIPLISY